MRGHGEEQVREGGLGVKGRFGSVCVWRGRGGGGGVGRGPRWVRDWGVGVCWTR